MGRAPKACTSRSTPSSTGSMQRSSVCPRRKTAARSRSARRRSRSPTGPRRYRPQSICASASGRLTNTAIEAGWPGIVMGRHREGRSEQTLSRSAVSHSRSWERAVHLGPRLRRLRSRKGACTSRPHPAHCQKTAVEGDNGNTAMRPCKRHPDVPRYPSGGCPVCTDLRQKKRRAAARRARGPKRLSPREKARRAGRQFYRGATCPRNHRGNPHGNLRYVANARCVECNRSYYPVRLSKEAKERKRIRSRDHSRRRARALRVLHELGLTI